MSNVWSTRTKTAIGSNLVQEKYITPYPDRVASTNAVTTATSTVRVSDAGSTTDDMSAMYMWKHGEELYGTHAKASSRLNQYERDINDAYGREKDYEPYFVDTTRPIGEQLKKR